MSDAQPNPLCHKAANLIMCKLSEVTVYSSSQHASPSRNVTCPVSYTHLTLPTIYSV